MYSTRRNLTPNYSSSQISILIASNYEHLDLLHNTPLLLHALASPVAIRLTLALETHV
jgi:hypothetical protein